LRLRLKNTSIPATITTFDVIIIAHRMLTTSAKSIEVIIMNFKKNKVFRFS